MIKSETGNAKLIRLLINLALAQKDYIKSLEDKIDLYDPQNAEEE